MQPLKRFTQCGSLTMLFSVFIVLFGVSSTALTTFGKSPNPPPPPPTQAPGTQYVSHSCPKFSSPLFCCCCYPLQIDQSIARNEPKNWSPHSLALFDWCNSFEANFTSILIRRIKCFNFNFLYVVKSFGMQRKKLHCNYRCFLSRSAIECAAEAINYFVSV